MRPIGRRSASGVALQSREDRRRRVAGIAGPLDVPAVGSEKLTYVTDLGASAAALKTDRIVLRY